MKHLLFHPSLLCLIPLFAQGSLLAQESAREDNAGSVRTVTFSNSLSYSYCGKTDMKGAGKALDGISSSHVNESFGCEIAVTEQLTLNLQTAYDGNFFDARFETAAPMVKRLQSLTGSLGTSFDLGNGWTVMGGAGGGCYSSGSRFDRHGTGVVAYAGAMKTWGEKLTAVFGLSYSSMAKDNHKIMPGFGIQYAFSREWSLSVGYPETALTWKAGDRLDISLVAEGECQTYYVRAGDIVGNTGGKSIGKGKMEYFDIRAGLRANYHVTGGLSLYATGGYLFARQFDFYDQNYKLESKNGAPYASIGLEGSF